MYCSTSRSAALQGVVAIAQLLDDVLQAPALQLGDAVGMGAQHQGAKHRIVAVAVGRAGLVLPDLGLAGLDEADVAQFADLAPVHGLGVGVLVHLDPLLAGLEVIGGVGVDDGHIAVPQGVGVHGAQLSCRLEKQFGGQLAVKGQGGAAGHRRLGAVRTHLGRIDHVGAARQHVPGQGVQMRVACTTLLSMAVICSTSVRGVQPPYWCRSAVMVETVRA